MRSGTAAPWLAAAQVRGERSGLRVVEILRALSWVALGCLPLAARAQIAVQNQGYIPFSDAPIHYRSNDLSDPVAKLQRRLDDGKASLVYDPRFGYLPSLLKLLGVPADSQTLVFSKTSFQYPKISPEYPRALYFNDDVYVGKVHDGKALEVVSFDPMQGAIFYLLDEHKVAHPVLQRAELDCTQCHIAAGTRGIPGVLLRSVYTTRTGTLVPGTRSFITDQNSPFSARWGGWYVTGYQGNAPHMGDAAVDSVQTAGSADTAAASPGQQTQGSPSQAAAAPTLQPLGHPYDPSAYVVPGSDVVALLVLAHQTQMHNLITLTNYETRLALYSYAHTQDAGAPKSDAGVAKDAPLPESVRQRFERPAEQLLRYMLFTNETALPDSGQEPIARSSAFAQEFQARGIRDPEGRSLRDFDLKTRIFRYPCSYLIYSDAFDAIPEPAKGYLYHRLLEILTGQDQSPDFARLSGEDRRAILEILLATKPGLPQEWREYAESNHLRIADERPRSISGARKSLE